jgi:hypothetical protein
MGSSQSTTKRSNQYKFNRPLKDFQNTCKDDIQCQNINSTLSVPGKDPVLVCPEAKCVSGACVCGSKCKKDPYMGICCKDVVEKQYNDYKTSFCIENFSNSTECNHPGHTNLFGKW